MFLETVPGRIKAPYGGTFVGIDHATFRPSALTSSCPPNFAGDDENPEEYVNLSEIDVNDHSPSNRAFLLASC
jgi:hypothetical protein